MSRTRVVITGMGVITPLGSSLKSYWEGLVAGRSGIRRVTHFDPGDLPCKIAGEVPDFEPKAYMERKEARRMPRPSQMALAAAIQAYQDASLTDAPIDLERVGIVFGTGVGGIDSINQGLQVYREKGYSRINPFTIPGGIPNLAAFQITRHLKILGPNLTLTTACAAGTHAVGEGAEIIRHNRADVVITGGSEAAVHDYTLAGFLAMRAIPTSFNDNPQAASRPFDAKREGFVFSEGAGVLILEGLEHALARNARIYAEVCGQASTGDGFHMAIPDPEAAGPIRAMKWALDDGGVKPEEVDYINAHGSATPVNDVTESRAIMKLFGEHAYTTPISSTKSMIGHPMGASGALEAIACVMAIQDNIIPPTINYELPDPECPLDYVPNQARRQNVDITLSNSFGLGGQNACLVLSTYKG